MVFFNTTMTAWAKERFIISNEKENQWCTIYILDRNILFLELVWFQTSIPLAIAVNDSLNSNSF